MLRRAITLWLCLKRCRATFRPSNRQHPTLSTRQCSYRYFAISVTKRSSTCPIILAHCVVVACSMYLHFQVKPEIFYCIHVRSILRIGHDFIHTIMLLSSFPDNLINDMPHYQVGKCNNPRETLLTWMGERGLQWRSGSTQTSGIILWGLWILMLHIKTSATR